MMLLHDASEEGLQKNGQERGQKIDVTQTIVLAEISHKAKTAATGGISSLDESLNTTEVRQLVSVPKADARAGCKVTGCICCFHEADSQQWSNTVTYWPCPRVFL